MNWIRRALSFFADLRSQYRADLSLREARLAEREACILANEMDLNKSLDAARGLRRKLQASLDALGKE